MQPVLSIDAMREADRRLVAEVGLETLVERAGYAAARTARGLLFCTYGARVVVVAGKGHNGDDGRVAARVLARRGAKVLVVSPGERSLPLADLVIDAAFGTGFRGSYNAPTLPSTAKVLALDVPSGLDANTGIAQGTIAPADHTVTFGAYKRGLFFGDGPRLAGDVELAPIGFLLDEADAWLVEDQDVEKVLPRRPRDAHKWQRAVLVVAGSAGMAGAARLAISGAMRAGATMVRAGSPGTPARDIGVTEAVAVGLPRHGLLDALSGELARVRALVVGPGLTLAPEVAAEVRTLVEGVRGVPMVIDADGLGALGDLRERPGLFRENGQVVLTPHAGEFARLAGRSPDPDPIEAAQSLARLSGATVLLKGPTTVVAPPEGAVRLVTAGTSRLATAGTGDVLSGVIGALLASGLDACSAASIGAHVHGRASAAAPMEHLVASELPDLVAQAIDRLAGVSSREGS